MFDPLSESQHDFELRYVERFTDAVFGGNIVSLPCTCEDGGGPTHWAAIPNTPFAIDFHRQHEETIAWLRERGQ